MEKPDFEDYVESVLRIVEQIPRGRVTTYGLIAEAVGRGGPRQVGKVMSLYGGPVPWWRVVRADGSLAKGERQRALLDAEGVPFLRNGKIDLRVARIPHDV